MNNVKMDKNVNQNGKKQIFMNRILIKRLRLLTKKYIIISLN